MLSIKTLRLGSTVFVNQMVPHASTSCCVIDLRFFADIFGSEVTRERGLIDRATEIDFEKDPAELVQVWNEREKAARQSSRPEFHSWFVRY